MFSLKGVSKTYGVLEAIAPIDLQAESARTTVLIGPSGCGKSTLIRLMAGLIRPDHGSIRFRDTEINEANLAELRLRMGYVIQEGGLFPHMSAARNTTIMARYLRWPREGIRQRLDELVGLTQFPSSALDREPGELSGGQRQRVSLMRALMLDPDVLLLDEPLGALDPMIRYELQQDLRRIFRQLRKTVVLVTHDLGEAVYLGDTIVLLREGRIVQQGPLHELLHHPADPFVERFVRAQRSPLDLPEA